MDARNSIAPSRRHRHVRLLVAAATGIAALATAASVVAADTDVTIANFAFAPDPVTVNVGDTITWTNNDSAPHTATADDGSFDTGQLAQGDSGDVTFDTAGSFAYHCSVHPNMTGTVVVEAAAGGGGGGGGAPAASTPPTDTVAPDGASGQPGSLLAIALAAVAVASVVAYRRAGRSR